MDNFSFSFLSKNNFISDVYKVGLVMAIWMAYAPAIRILILRLWPAARLKLEMADTEEEAQKLAFGSRRWKLSVYLLPVALGVTFILRVL